MSLLRQLQALRQQYLAHNDQYLRTPIFIHGGIPDAEDPGKATRKLLIPHYVIWHGLPSPVMDAQRTEYEVPEVGHVSPEPSESDMEPEDAVIA